MAASNMIVTLAMNATKYAAGLRQAAGQTSTFGKFASRAFDIAKTAFIGLTISAIRLVPVLAQMGAESRKADIQLRFMLENMEGVGAATDAAVKRMAAYADQVNKATGIDDEQIKAIQRKLLAFDSLRKSAGELGGTFERTTGAAIDLSAAGLGDMESTALKLGKALEDPTRRMRGLADAGVIFNDVEKKKIASLQESGKLFEAQEIVLQRVEDRVKGIAEASATPFEKMNAQFQQIGDSIGEAMLPALEDMNKEVSAWLSTPQGRKDVQVIADGFVSAAYGIKEMANFLRDVRNLLEEIKPFTDLLDQIGRFVIQNRFGFITELPGQLSNLGGGNSGSGGGGGRSGTKGIVVNFNAPVDSVSAGREVARVLADYSRANGVR
jgi:hypothetical protein